MRGALRCPLRHENEAGIIPADAGSTRFCSSARDLMRDHPRGCGEHQPARRVRKSFTGSSPRMRGALHAARHDEACRGIIPADAGSTPGPDGSAARSRDHPRGCGEHGSPWLTNTAQPGSSPRMRGAPADRPVRPPIPGIIPADAGSTRSWPAPRVRSRDHPRGCGEHLFLTRNNSTDKGSSPRMRGARRGRQEQAGRVGIIPADAGSTPTPRRRSRSWGDHPRGCGEHT